ncbi:P-type DNA transfer protein VirB5 (plasmid) [Sphaerotilaceae bacterium SBD11-9]
MAKTRPSGCLNFIAFAKEFDMKKWVRAFVLAAGVMTGQHAFAGIPTIDVANLVSSIQQVLAWMQQYEQMMQQIQGVQRQVQQAEQMYNNISGIRNMADLVNNPALRQYMPQEWSQAISLANNPGSFGNLSSSIRSIQQAARLTGLDSTTLDPNSAAGRSFSGSQAQAATNRAMSEAGYKAATDRIANIQTLLDQINAAPDQKDILDLQARIQAESTMVENENAKLAALGQLQQAQRDIAYQQAREVSMLSSKGALPAGW